MAEEKKKDKKSKEKKTKVQLMDEYMTKRLAERCKS